MEPLGGIKPPSDVYKTPIISLYESGKNFNGGPAQTRIENYGFGDHYFFPFKTTRPILFII